MQNKFFDIALKTAARMAGRKGRITLLLGKLAYKISTVNWKSIDVNAGKDKFLLFGRLVKAYVTGSYRDVPWKSLLLMLAAIIYFINPIDLIPDIVPVLGFTDDFSVLFWIYDTVGKELDKFLTWEKSKLTLT